MCVWQGPTKTSTCPSRVFNFYCTNALLDRIQELLDMFMNDADILSKVIKITTNPYKNIKWASVVLDR